MSEACSILDGYDPEAAFAAGHKISIRTTARYRNQPDGLPYVMFGGKVYIPRDEAKEWLRSRIKRPNQRRRAA